MVSKGTFRKVSRVALLLRTHQSRLEPTLHCSHLCLLAPLPSPLWYIHHYLGFNMLALQLFGKQVQARYGNRYVWALYLAGACAGSVAMNYCMPYDTIEMPKVGADPCISTFFSFIAVQNPRLALFTLILPVRMWFLLALATGFVVVSDSSFKNLGGLLMGAGLGLLRRRLPF